MSASNRDNEPADDVATLYSWANLHGAKYRDFSASRQEVRTQMRQRAVAERARLAREDAQRQAATELEKPLWEDRLPAGSRQTAASLRSESPVTGHHEIASRGSRDDDGPVPYAELLDGSRAAELNGTATPSRYALPIHEEDVGDPLTAHARFAEFSESEAGSPVRPAWLAEMPLPPSAPAAPPAASKETLQQSRERVASRWFALQNILGRGPEEHQPERAEGQAPVVALFSLAGGVGKTSLVASLGRALASRGERVLLADTCSFGVLPFYFGARETKPGVLRTFSGGTSDPPIRMLTVDAERERGDTDLLRREVTRGAQDVSRVLIDIATGSAASLRQALRLSATVLVPVVPDMTSMVTLQSLESFFRNQEGGGKPLQAWYVLNQFDAALPLHLDVREVLRQQLGERLLPFAVHRSSAISEALAEGMTVIDYAPNSPAAEDLMNLVTWIRNTLVAVAGGSRGIRWSER